MASPQWTSDGSAVLLGMVLATTGAGTQGVSLASRGFSVVRVGTRTSEVHHVGTYAVGQNWASDSFTFSADGKTLYLGVFDDSGSHVVALDLGMGQNPTRLPGVTGVRRVVERVRTLTGQNREVRPVVAWFMGVAPRPGGQTVALNLMKGENAYLVTMNVDGSGYRELYGPVIGRQYGNAISSRLSDPKWLRGDLGMAFGIQQENLSWKLMRVTEDGRSGPLNTGGRAEEFMLEPGTLQFDISPDGKRVAYERLMSFSNELWTLDLSSALKMR